MIRYADSKEVIPSFPFYADGDTAEVIAKYSERVIEVVEDEQPERVSVLNNPSREFMHGL